MMKSFIKLPNAIWSYCLSAGELQVYTALTDYANRLGSCTVRHASVAARCSISVATVARAVHQLAGKGLISITKRYDRQGQLVANRYTITPLAGSFTRIPRFTWGYKLAKSDFKVYLYLIRCMSDNRAEAIPSLSQMVSVLSMSKRTIVDAVNSLSSLLLLYKEQYHHKQDRRMGHNRYRVVLGAARHLWASMLVALGERKRREALCNRATRLNQKKIQFSRPTIAYVARKVKDFLCNRAFLLRPIQLFVQKFVGTILIRQ